MRASIRRATSAPISRVLIARAPGPAISGVRRPATTAWRTARSTVLASRISPSEWRSSSAALRIAASGLALPWPVISGAVPWIGS